MRYKIILASLFTVLLFGLLVYLPFGIQAAGVGDVGTNLGAAAQKAGLTKDNYAKGTAKTSLPEKIGEIIKYILQILGVVAIIYTIYGGALWITSGGNAEKATQGRKAITNAVIGIIALTMAYVFVAVALSFGG